LSHIIQGKHKQELEALKAAHATTLAEQAAECQVLMLQLDTDKVNIEQLKKALDQYQQREVRLEQYLSLDVVCGTAKAEE